MVKRIIQSVERYFWFWSVAATVLGIWLPGPFAVFRHTLVMNAFLMGILFFTCLRVDVRAVGRELRNYLFILYVAAVILLACPAAAYGATRLLAPEWTLGFLILGAVPAGMAGGALTHLCGGNASLALGVTMVTSVLCPFTIPPVVKLFSGRETSASVLLVQVGVLMVLVFVPLAAAHAVRTLFPAAVRKHEDLLGGLSILSICFLILGAVSRNSTLVRERFDTALFVLGLTFVFSACSHAVGFLLPVGRPLADRIAVSINTAYVNNGLAIVFAMTFFADVPEAVLPAVLLEFPMILMILPLRWIARRRMEAAA